MSVLGKYAILREMGRRITPFARDKRVFMGLSYGLSVCSYDLRLESIDKERDGVIMVKGEPRPYWLLHPGECFLGVTKEKVHMPSDVMGMIADKSTWAREFVALQHTHIDTGFKGHITLEISSHAMKGSHPVRLVQGIPICQMIMHRVEDGESYSGKYQDAEAVPQAAIYEGMEPKAE